MQKKLSSNIDIIMVGTLQSGNIGSASRAMNNMGFGNLTLVHPKCAIDEQACWMATHGKAVLDAAKNFATLREALAESAYVFGTTARGRKSRRCLTPGQMAAKAVSLARSNRVAIVFGPEDMGLSNDELDLCDEAVTIPTAGRRAQSLNIAQAVMVVCYEMYLAADRQAGADKVTKLASSAQREEMYDHMRATLLEIGFLNPQNPDQVLGKFRRMVTRAGLTAGEVDLIRGVFRQLQWYGKKKEADNKKGD